jgi:hypothetical protein
MNRRFRKLPYLAIALGMVLWTVPNFTPPAEANNLSNVETVFSTDFVSVGYGGIRDFGSGTLTVAGVSGTVTKAYLYWQGPSNDVNSTLAVTFAGSSVTGTNIGSSSDNCWGFDQSDAFRADVTSLVTGNGAYAFSGMVQNAGNTNVNGTSLVVFFDDGNEANDRDVVIFQGNDSNQPNVFDADGWNASLSGINYTTGTANLQFHVADGQAFGCSEPAVLVNGSTLLPSGGNYEGDTVPNGPTAPSTLGGLWDIETYNVTSFLSPGPNTLTVTAARDDTCDCLGLVVAIIDLPAGAAPTEFDKCIQDKKTRNLFRWNSTTGAYEWVRCDTGIPFATGVGVPSMEGPICRLIDTSNGRNVNASINSSTHYGVARIRLVPGGKLTSLYDFDTDDECACRRPGGEAKTKTAVPNDGRIRHDGRVYSQ